MTWGELNSQERAILVLVRKLEPQTVLDVMEQALMESPFEPHLVKLRDIAARRVPKFTA
ncbi:hypothetical protein GMLC_41760 [Geomonas limicola]|uniref:Uncharacterized protein n=2 Tax=Geomonas TaxID=2651583 RepID=A0A6V8MPN3_9BACT|nr:hypothetical protein [Geomonas silvestris]GFO62016.1 hypothetical protein GMST_43410 [Geomonas silvestris]GFO70597.1 hypothetical protein GMLC_41760 [Geomonas limicola]